MQKEVQGQGTTDHARRHNTVRRQRRSSTRSDWQRLLLPFMVAMVGGLTIFFFWISFNQLETLQARIEQAPTVDLAPALDQLETTALAGSDRLLYVQWKTLALLEQQAIERRYHQANVLLMSRTWVRYLGFITGMILALVGAAFILGKLREEASDLKLSSKASDVTFRSTSPGLFLGVLGTILMLTTMLAHNEIDTRDAPLYTNFVLAPGASSMAVPMPPAELEVRSDSAILMDLETP